MSSQSTHLLLFAFPWRGHLLSAFNLAQTLTAAGASVTLVCSENQIRALLEDCCPQQLSRIVLLGLPDPDPEKPNFPSDSVTNVVRDLENAIRLRSSFDGLIAKLIQEKLRDSAMQEFPMCIVSDYFLYWTREVAAKYDIPWYAFHAASASHLALQFYTRTMLASILPPLSSLQSDEQIVRFPDLDEPIRVPGLFALSVTDLTETFRNNISRTIHEFGVLSAESLHEAAGVLVNTCEDLEPRPLEALRNDQNLNPARVNVFAIGPCFPSASLCNDDVSSVTLKDQSASNSEVKVCMKWLDNQQPSSVLYISLGSLFIPTLHQIRELAVGLEASEQRFFWVVRPPICEQGTQSGSEALSEILPPGFLSRTKEKGVVLPGWAPQLQILSHPAVGGFLSHCGWNSTLESIFMGVPIIAFPQFGDQILNSRIIAEELKVGVVLQSDKGEVQSHDIESAVRNLMHDNEMRRRTGEWRDRMRRAVAEHGVSQASTKSFIQDIFLQRQVSKASRNTFFQSTLSPATNEEIRRKQDGVFKGYK
ncbi:hypothetical protein O6H91_11G071800 [Diphasiastrum complanatum]|uniref:Uncharacterized protein n=2 Tax=Diphasiastrum complanatum TaxID=34168 RepID=A0ACC2CAJ5_DIPCM|nr:hypothetical protein O6H91_11G015300 [Diphasiastrum complanatum]KAJ7538990.1 hypothetical protein O6H91_11G071800 [Diphasiastrum complanatum]